jgi:hypothetical protein
MHIPKWAHTLGIGVMMDSRIFIEWYQRSKLIGWKSFLYHWKVLGTYMFKMGSHDPFGYLKQKLWSKERSGVKLPIWLRSLKVDNRPYFLACRWRATYRWKDVEKGYNFATNLTSIGGLHTKLWNPKIAKIPISKFWEFQDSHLGVPGQNDIWVLAPWLSTKNIIRWKVVASPKSGPWWVLWVYVCLWFVHAPEVLWLCINQLVVWFVRVRVNNWIACCSS